MPLVLAGLERLEYRGYDSAGVATLEPNKKPEVHQAVGKVKDLVSHLNGRKLRGALGLGHTRWATHGRSTVANAHPHTDCLGRVALAHNGIVENFMELKEGLLAKGHAFTSETDSEVIAHVIEEEMAEDEDFEAAFSRMALRIRGANVVAAICEGDTDRILVLRLGNAGGIAVARKNGETMLASDLGALVSFSNEVTFLEDGEIVSVRSGAARFKDLKGATVVKEPHRMPRDWVSVGKGGYRHFMLKEIMEQPRTVAGVMQGRVNLHDGRVTLKRFPLTEPEVRELNRVVLVGSGTSYHAALLGRNLMDRFLRLPVDAESSSEFRYREPALDERSLMVSVGQSGETADTLSAMEWAKRQGARLVTICNVEGSQAARMAEGWLSMRAGPEIGVASTKTFLASMSLLALLSIQMSQASGSLPEGTRREILAQLIRLPDLLNGMLADHTPYKKLARRLYRYDHILYLGRGMNHPVALEGALKLKELSYIHAEGYAAGEMKHGPIALIDHKMPTVALAPRSGLYDKMMNSIKEVKARDGMVVALGAEGDDELASQADHVLYVPDVPELLTPFLTVVPLQLLAYYVAVERGCDVDQPRNLAKSVTVE